MARNATLKIPLSGSTQGLGIKVVPTSTLGTTVHASGIGLYTTVFDSVYSWAYNHHTADVLLTLEWGGVTSPDNLIALTVPAKSGLFLVTDGFIIAGNGSAAKTITAFAGTANVIMLYGYVLRTTV